VSASALEGAGLESAFHDAYLVIRCGPEWPPFKRPAIVEKLSDEVNFQPDRIDMKQEKEFSFSEAVSVDGEPQFCG
jgi:hypothetical protein